MVMSRSANAAGRLPSPQGQTRDLGGANSSTSPAVDVPKAPQGQTAGSGNIEQEGGWLGAVARGLVGTIMAPVRHDSPAQAVDVAAWDPAADGGLTSFEQKISEARMWNTVDPGHVVVSNLKGIDTPYNDHFRVVGQELTAKQLASARAIQYCDETGAKHGWVTSEGAADILWSREGKLLKAVNTHATYDTQPGFAASLRSQDGRGLDQESGVAASITRSRRGGSPENKNNC